MQDFRDKIAVITGGASGIGLGIARAIASEGGHVVVADIDETAAKAAADDLTSRGVRSLAVRCDVRDDASVDAVLTPRKWSSAGSICSLTMPASTSAEK